MKTTRRRDHTTPRTSAECLAESEAWQLRAELMDGDDREIMSAFKKSAYWASVAQRLERQEARRDQTAAAMPPAAVDAVQPALEAPMTTMQGMNAIVSRRLRKGAKP